ncbi:MAG: Gfo/Idh/MocA family oxidoreductase [Chloroflexota bacterium]
MAKKYRVGIIGHAGRGDYGHGLDLVQADVANIDIVAVADVDQAGLRAAGERTGAASLYPNYWDMLQHEKLDLVSVAPRFVDQHADMLLACAEAGVKGVFCEKPMAKTLQEADAVLAACEKSGMRIAVAHRRANAYEQRVKSLIEAGELGDIHTITSRGKGDHRVGGQDLAVLGTHMMDSMRYFAGADVDWVFGAVTQNGRDATIEDAREGNEGIGLIAGDRISATFGFNNGIIGHFESVHIPDEDGLAHARWFGLEVHGTKGIVTVRNSPAGEMHIYRHGMWIPGNPTEWEVVKIDTWDYDDDGNERSGGDQMHLSNNWIVTELIKAIEADQEVTQASSGYDARAALEMIMGIHESHLQQQRVSFPLAERENPYGVRLA